MPSILASNQRSFSISSHIACRSPLYVSLRYNKDCSKSSNSNPIFHLNYLRFLNETNPNMHSASMLQSLVVLASLASAIPTQRDIYHGVSIEVQTSPLTDPVVVTSPVPVELYHLTICSSGSNGEPCSASKLSISPNVHPNVSMCFVFIISPCSYFGQSYGNGRRG